MNHKRHTLPLVYTMLGLYTLIFNITVLLRVKRSLW